MTLSWPELKLSDAEARSVRARLPSLTRETDGGCLEWAGNAFASGYGSIKRRGRRMLAHRVVYAALVGAIPADMTIDHLCRNRRCVRVEHLEVVSLAENVRRSEGLSAQNARKTHCRRGHALVTGNLVLRTGRKHRTCLACHRESSREAGRRWRAKPENLEKRATEERERRSKMKNGLIRQGDVLLIPCAEPDMSKLDPAPKDPRGLVLAEGETSFHYHGVVGKGRHHLFNFRDSTQRMLQVGGRGAELRVIGGGAGGVDRHTPVSLAPGKYLVRVQRSWTSENASRQVQD